MSNIVFTQNYFAKVDYQRWLLVAVECRPVDNMFIYAYFWRKKVSHTQTQILSYQEHLLFSRNYFRQAVVWCASFIE